MMAPSPCSSTVLIGGPSRPITKSSLDPGFSESKREPTRTQKAFETATLEQTME